MKAFQAMLACPSGSIRVMRPDRQVRHTSVLLLLLPLTLVLFIAVVVVRGVVDLRYIVAVPLASSVELEGCRSGRG